MWLPGDVFLEVEWLEVGHVLLFSEVEGTLCEGEHPLGQRHNSFDEMGIFVLDDALTLCCSVAEEPDLVVVAEVGEIGVGAYDVCSHGPHLAERAVVDGAVNLHPPGINHGDEECIVGEFLLPEQYGDAEELEGGHAQEREVAAVADALCHGDADAQAGIAAGSFAHGHGIDGDGMGVGKGEGFLDEDAADDGVVRPLEVFLVEDEASVLAQSHGAGFRAGLDVQDAGHFPFSFVYNFDAKGSNRLQRYEIILNSFGLCLFFFVTLRPDMEKKEKTGKVFLIAGSEPLGSAGVQADIKAITRCGGWAAAALTCIVDEDVRRIKGIHHLPEHLIVSQAESFLSTVGADCIKTGLLPTDGIIRAVADVLRRYRRQPILVDPVIVNFEGKQLVSDDAIRAYKDELFPLATLITPNIREAEFLLGHPLRDAEADLRRLSEWGCDVLVKSVEEGKYLVDYLYEREKGVLTPHPKKRLALDDRNGTGDTLASAIATHLAMGDDLSTAVMRAEAYMNYFLAGPRYYISADL